MMREGFCLNCFDPHAGGVCPRCGYEGEGTRDVAWLAAGVVLHERYLLGRVLGMGGFGITYLALDLSRNECCAVKEFFPTGMALRHAGDGNSVVASSQGGSWLYMHGLRVFQNEARILLDFAGQEGIVQVWDAFEENGTSYYAMEYLRGPNLQTLAQQKGGSLPVESAQELLFTVALTLDVVHTRRLLHRDVSPENILTDLKGRAKLIDFGATRLFLSERSQSLSVVLRPGYAPPEQYASGGNQGPWTDIYALCATFYALLTGIKPPTAPDRLGGTPMAPLTTLLGDTAFARALDWGLALDYRKRPQSAAALLDAWAKPEPPKTQQVALPKRSGSIAKEPPPKASPCIRMLQDGRLGEPWRIPPDREMRIGRSADQCDLLITQPGVSRLHCTVLYSAADRMFYVKDLSSGGTLLPDGKRCVRGETYPLSPGTMFYVLSPEFPVVLEVD